ncbi:MAG TPA: STAUR_1299 family protein [Myxococcales bacterium]|nr:STAUR_1299 family protein [Myxococcales bacterium]
MDDRISSLLDLAYRTVAAADANTAIAQARQEAAESGAAHSRPLRNDEAAVALSRSYELVVDPEADWDGFAENVLPRLVYHLESVGARPPLYKGIVIAAFAGDRLHFLRAADVLTRAAELMGITVDELFRRHGTGESRTARRDPPLALPGPDRER